LVGRRVLVFAEAPTPRLCLEYLLERHGIRLASVDLVDDVPAVQAGGRVRARGGAYPPPGPAPAPRLRPPRQAHLAAALGPALGPMAFSAYLVTPRLMAERAHVLDAVLRALYRAQRWLGRQRPDAIAERVAPFFPGEDRAVLTAAIQRYVAGR